MTSKGLKPAIARPSAREALAAADAVAQQAGLPPAALSPRPTTPIPTVSPLAAAEEELVQVNIRVRRGLGDQLADRARAEGTTQKVLVCRALAAAGFEVHSDDLRPTPPPRRRGSS
jgi:hypothetical protein